MAESYSKRQGNVVFLTQKPEDSVTESDMMSVRSETPYAVELLANKFVDYQEAAEDEREETFDELEDRMEKNIYNARATLRDGQRETALLGSELQQLQFKVFNANHSTVNQIRSEIESLSDSFQRMLKQDRNETVFIEGQMGSIRMENARDSFVIRQMAVKEEKIARAIGAENDFFEVIPGYLKAIKESKGEAAVSKHV